MKFRWFLKQFFFDPRITKLTNEISNQTNEILKKDQDYQHYIESIYDAIIYCIECLSNDSTKPFIIEPSIISRDDTEVYSSKLKVNEIFKFGFCFSSSNRLISLG
jgi:hypothetical protein